MPIDCNVLSGVNLKAFTVIHLMDYMDELGPDVAASWRDTLPAAARAATERKLMTSVGWLPVEYYFHGVSFLARRDGKWPRGAVDIGHTMASRDIGAFFRFVLGFTTPGTILTLSGRFWRSYFSGSMLKVISSTERSVHAEVSDWPLQDESSMHEIAGSLIAWMEASRARNVRIARFERSAPKTLTIFAEWD